MVHLLRRGRRGKSLGHHIYVLENSAANPRDGEWIERGQLKTNWESFALDATTFEHCGTRYLVWAQKDQKIKGHTNLYLAKMAPPTSIAGVQVMRSKPDLAWEQVRYWVNEGPAVSRRHGRVWLTYSAAGTGTEYCLDLLSADENADLLDPKSWTKSPVPVFTTSEANGVFGPGHNSLPRRLTEKPICWFIMRATIATSRATRCTIPTATPASRG